MYVHPCQVGDVIVDNVTSVEVSVSPTSLNDVSIQHNLNYGLQDEAIHVAPLNMAVEMVTGEGGSGTIPETIGNQTDNVYGDRWWSANI